MSFSFALTSASVQKYSCNPWTHSKYETTTPPALASTSGRTRTPLPSRISSAAGVVGPLAPSHRKRVDAVGVLDRDHLLERAGREDVAVERQELLGVDLLRRSETSER